MDAPAVAVTSDGKKIAVAWMDTREGASNRNVYWTLSAGGRFAPETAVHDDTQGAQGHPALVFDKDGVAWCAWEDARGGPNNQQIYVTESKTRKNVAVSAGRGAYPSLASSAAGVAVAYEAGDDVACRILAAP